VLRSSPTPRSIPCRIDRGHRGPYHHTEAYGGGCMMISVAEHAAGSWRIAEIAPDFELIDAWALPISAPRPDVDGLEALFDRLAPAALGPATAMLFQLRRRLGAWFGWEEHANALPIPGCRESSLRERLPPDLRVGLPAPLPTERFRVVYRTP